MRIKKIIFDLDGTLINSEKVFMNAYTHALNETHAKKKYNWKEIENALGPNEVGVIKKLSPHNFEACIEKFYAKEKELIKEIIVFPGIIQYLKKCKEKNINLSIVTGRAKKHANLFLNHFSIRHYFDEILTGSELKDIKSENLESLVGNTPKNNVIYLGDTVKDMLAANKIGVLSGLCLWKNSTFVEKRSYPEADLIFKNVEDLKKLGI